jgi:hypothetical protein
MKAFHLPRKTKKKLSKGMWLYPSDEKGNSILARPAKQEDDYVAFRNGLLRKLGYSKNNKEERLEEKEKLDVKVAVSDVVLKTYIDDIFAEEYRYGAYVTLLDAKKHPKAIICYYNFINAYKLNDEDDSYGNTCCMIVDHANWLMRRRSGKRKKSSQRWRW